MAQPVPGSRHARRSVQAAPSRQPLLYLNLRPFAWAGMALLVVLPPYLRGLFFQPELLLVQILVAITFAFWVGDRLLRQGQFRDARTVPLAASPGDYGMAGRGPGRLRLEALDFLVGLYVTVYLLSLLQAVNVRAAVGEVLEVLALAMLYFVVSRLILTPRNVVQVLAMIFWAAVGVAVIGLGAALGVIYYPGAFDGRVIMSTFQYKNTLAAYLTTVSVIGIFLQARCTGVVPRVLHGAGNVLVLVTLLSTQSRGGWIMFPLVYILFFLGVPRSYSYRSLYTLLLDLGVGMVVSRSFLPAVLAGQRLEAGMALVIGLVALAVIEVAVDLGLRLAGRLRSHTRTFLSAAGAVYGVFIVILYLYFAGQAFPSVAGQFLPSQVIARAQTISSYEPSFKSRLTYDVDALHILADYPLTGAGGGGWNALYHQYQESLYFTTEVHNHFLQVGVEAGLPGLVVFALLWVALAFLLVRLRRKTDDDAWLAPTWTAGVAAFGLAGHSFFDFNLSLPATGMLVWILLALARGTELALDTGGAAAAGRHAGTTPPETPRWRATLNRLPALLSRPLGWGIIGAFLAAALFLPSYNFYRAGRTGAEAAQALAAREFPRAQELYRAAHRLDPYTATYVADLAQVNTALGLAEQDETLLEEARGLAIRAASLEPYNPQIRATLSLVYLLQGYLDLAVAEAEAVVAANPWDAAAYEQLGGLYVAAARAYGGQGEAGLAQEYLGKALALSQRVREKAQQASGPWQGPRLTVTPRLEMVQGQAAYLARDYGPAVEYLERAVQDKSLEQEAVPWLAAALARSGRQEEAEEYLARYPGLRSQYEALREE